jgi:hypothetical protein
MVFPQLTSEEKASQRYETGQLLTVLEAAKDGAASIDNEKDEARLTDRRLRERARECVIASFKSSFFTSSIERFALSGLGDAVGWRLSPGRARDVRNKSDRWTLLSVCGRQFCPAGVCNGP